MKHVELKDDRFLKVEKCRRSEFCLSVVLSYDGAMKQNKALDFDTNCYVNEFHILYQYNHCSLSVQFNSMFILLAL